MNLPIRVLIVEQETSFRQAIRTLLENKGGITIVGKAQSGQQALDLLQNLRPDVIVWDAKTLLASEDTEDNLQTLASMSELYPHGKILVRGAEDERLALEALRNGAQGYLSASSSEALIRAVRTVNQGGAVLNPATAGQIIDEMTRRKEKR
jgi:DNA-binding NarL/FixJ family response regulator